MRRAADWGDGMIWALLAILGVPVWLVVGMLAGALYSRRRYRRHPDVFRCAGRVRSGDVGPFTGEWGRTPAYARWVHDVLLVSRGVALVRITAIPVDAVVAAAGPVDDSPPRRLGDDAVAITVRTDDGSVLQLAAERSDRDRLTGSAVVSRPSLGAEAGARLGAGIDPSPTAGPRT